MSLQSWFYPSTPGFKEDTTSREAAEAIASRTGQLQRLVLNHLALAGPSTADEIANMTGETQFSIRPRCTELLRMGKIKDCGLRRKNSSGRNAKVWSVS